MFVNRVIRIVKPVKEKTFISALLVYKVGFRNLKEVFSNV